MARPNMIATPNNVSVTYPSHDERRGFLLRNVWLDLRVPLLAGLARVDSAERLACCPEDFFAAAESFVERFDAGVSGEGVAIT